MDRITLRGVRAHGRHGANPGERDAEQPFDLDVTLDVDLRTAQRSDDLGDTVNYAVLHATLVSIVESTSFALIERLAGALLDAAFVDPRIVRAEISVAKPKILAGATPVVTLRRENPRYRASFP